MTTEPHAFLALDLGSATIAAGLIGRVDGRWRLLGSLAVPSLIPLEAMVDLVAARLRAADPELATEVGLSEAADPASVSLPRLVVRTGPAPRMAVVAATDRALSLHVAVARRAGWDARGLSAESADPLRMSRLLLDPAVGAVLAGASDPPGADERGMLADLGAVVAAVVTRRPELAVILSGALTDEAGRFEPAPTPDDAMAEAPAPRTGALLLGPAVNAGTPSGEPLRVLLDELRTAPDDGRRAIVRATATLATVLDRTVETVEIGAAAGLRAVASPGGAGAPPTVRWAVRAEGALVPAEVSDEVVDGVLGWSALALDRHRVRDRLRELGIAPWAEAHGDGAIFRLAAARAAISRLVAASHEIEPQVAPDLVVAAGGAWAVAPGPAVALALADALRRPGTSHLALDHARLLGPLGAIEDEGERRRIVADLVDDLLAPLGAVVVPAGLHAGRSAGRLVVHGATGLTELDLVPGGLELVDLPPGESAIAEFRFREPVTIGPRASHFTVEVGGGLGGLLVDLRDVPLRLPDRLDRRRELLGAWQRALWAGMDE